MFKHRERLSEWLADPDNRRQLACIVAAGGDGTIADVFNRHPGVRLAILPLGTENLVARFLGISESGVEVARLIARGEVRVLDLCQMGRRRFALMAIAGFDADVVQRLHIPAAETSRVSVMSNQSSNRYVSTNIRKFGCGSTTPLCPQSPGWRSSSIFRSMRWDCRSPERHGETTERST